VERPVHERLGSTPPATVALAALHRAKAAAEARGLRPGSPVRRRGRGAEVQMSSAARDGRDPALVGDALARLATERGWSAELSVGGVVGRWREVVGDQVADHCTPETFDDGLLVVRTDSTAWATQVRLLVPQLLQRLEVELGPDVVRDVKVLGPAGAQWGHGQRRVPGRGPRDTYG
jgi:predicted nucleic acid-binding Zn ribbon protein